ncbi:hypothetical protein HZC07_02805 [Candidatus Micrarchaeota archaeon]|nr:hypothetical protein [Candidatus Micrarchaeota archaeon]
MKPIKAVNSAQLSHFESDPEDNVDKLKKLEEILEKLRSGWVFVEGKRDKDALQKLGCSKIFTISGNLRLSCDQLEKQLQESGEKTPVFVLTDHDRRGDELAIIAKNELESRSISVDLETRKLLGRMLGIVNFEDAKRGYDRVLKEEKEKDESNIQKKN